VTDQRTVRIRVHQGNLDRYCRLLTGHLTDVERQFLHKRIAEERTELERVLQEGAADSSPALANNLATSAVAKRGASHL
jgi:hypothetical protein